MIHFLSRVLLWSAAICLVACASHKVVVTPDKSPAVCKKTCHNRLKTCQQACHNNGAKCTFTENQSTVRRYGRYMNEQCVQGGIIMRDLQSYRDPLQCRKTTCNCWADYHVCAQSCSGVIHKRLQIAPACC